MKKPVIGITCNYTPGKDEDEATLHLYTSYVRAIQVSGGIPQLIPLSPLQDIPDLLDLYDGLLLSGGELQPHTAQMKSLPSLYEQNPIRHEFERALTRAVLEIRMPILGVCRGHQTINDVLGGTLTNIEEGYHLQEEPGMFPLHEIRIESQSLLYECCLSENTRVNSFHRQAVSRLGSGLKVTAYSQDGLIEAIEGEEYSFLMGVQFHPEYMISNHQGMARIYARLVEEAQEYKRRNIQKIIN